MKKIFLLMIVALMAITLHPGNAGAWLFGQAPEPEFSPKELKENAEEICLADLKYELRHKSKSIVDSDERYNYSRLWYDVKKGEAFLTVDARYKVGDFGEYRRTGIMGWPFLVFCNSKAVTDVPQFGKFDCSRQSSISCFIWVREGDGAQLFVLPKHLLPLVNRGK